MVYRFKPTNEKFAFVDMTSFKYFDNEIPRFYFGSMPPHAQTFLEKAVVNLSMPNIALEQEVMKSSWLPLRLRLYCIYMLLMYTPTKHIQPKPNSNFALKY